MRRWTTYMLLMPVLVVQALSSCMSDDNPIENTEGTVNVSLAFSLSASTPPQTRMADEVTQVKRELEKDVYRGIQDVMIIPFGVSNPANGVQSTDMPKAFRIEELSNDVYSKPNNSITSNSKFYYYDKCSFMRGVNAALFYGRAKPQNDPVNSSSDVANKAYNGSIVVNRSTDMAPANTTFKLEQMFSGDGTPVAAQAIATYLTNIARATDWSITDDSKLRAFYLNFTGQANQERDNAILAGSSASVTAYVNDLKTEIEKLPESDIRSAILTAIGTPSLGDYPASIGLPDGAAALRWDNEEGAFVPQTITTTDAAINSITRFTYPAELYYFGNSQLYMSNEEVANTVYNTATDTDTKTAWEQVLEHYPGRTPVSGNTKAVALKAPIQYAVAQLEMTLKEPEITLTDGKDNTVSYSQETMPLTGIIIGGQHTLGYNFMPQGTYNPADPGSADLDHRFIYDSNVSGLTSNTLVLQSYDNEKVKVILEFENNKENIKENAFVGKDGIIYPGTKFYLIGEIDPATKEGTGLEYGRVFTQDYTTMVTMKFNANSLKNAYNVMPDLLSPRLEIGVELVNKWIQAEPATVQLD